ncbi:D-altronate dehydratase [Consotaella salsifontis]|uniref:D-altronate dehydratase n=1 Tax=Consotaella salsifontis TaxID=1365950 RepID=A0A1T4LJC5_9HYPH|nr:D-altronate dehydratase [Consotaella salsifontis]
MLSDFGARLMDDVPQGHKLALKPHQAGDPVIKYGSVIGLAKEAIEPGQHIHTHNIKTALGGLQEYSYAGPADEIGAASSPQNAPTIDAYVRANGEIGVRNDLWIIPLVGCINGLAKNVARRFERMGALPEGCRVLVLDHPYGCSQLGDDLDNTRNILRDLAVHPNAGGVLIMGLGCENNTRELFIQGFEHPDPRRIRYLTTQEVGDEMEAALSALCDLSDVIGQDRRESVSASRLRIGLKCGGSDGFSGITGNPLLGAFSDWLCSMGGASVLTEVPEMFGAEQILMQRAENREVFDKIVSLINDFKQYFLDHDQPVYENPSPGNKAGGISTLEEKSLGCTQKAGRSIVRDVIRYGQRIKTSGLTLLEAPGNDGTAVTALTAAGCHIVLFTTGRGTPLGGVVPTIKVSTNTDLAARKGHWIDFDAGPVAAGLETVDGLLPTFIDTVLAIANGRSTRNEDNDVHDVVIFKTGVTL